MFGGNRQLSYVELNLETWRQLWRVLEMSDIILLIADIRYPVSCQLCSSVQLLGIICCAAVKMHACAHHFAVIHS